MALKQASMDSEILRIICRVCEKQYAKYTCPRCNARYCSLLCYKSHSTGCTESFYRENMVKELQGTKSSELDRQKMMATLQRLHMEEEEEGEGGDDNSDEDEGATDWLSSETIAKVLADDRHLSLEDLTPEEQKAFRRAAATGELSRHIDVWQPWWTLPATKSLSLTAGGCSLVKASQTQDVEVPEPTAIPSPPDTDIPPLKSLSKAEPSPLLIVHLMDVLYGYCFALRLYNGEWTSDPLGAAGALLGISSVLGHSSTPETADEALLNCLQHVCSPEWRDSGGLAFGVLVMGDVASILDSGRPAVICALADCQRIVEATIGIVPSDAKVGSSRNETVVRDEAQSGPRKQRKESKRMQFIRHKLGFFLAWANEQLPEIYKSSVSLVQGCWQKQTEELEGQKKESNPPISSSSIHSDAKDERSKKMLITELTV